MVVQKTFFWASGMIGLKSDGAKTGRAGARAWSFRDRVRGTTIGIRKKEAIAG